MRVGIVAVGAILLFVGFILAYVPMPGPGIPSTTTSNQYPGAILNVSSPPFLFFTNNLPFSVSWTATTALAVDVYPRASDSTCATVVPNSSAPVAAGSGASGSVSFTAHKGQYYEIYGKPTAASPPATWNATFSAKYSVPFIGGSLGFFLLVLGIVILIVGLVLKKPKPPSPAPTSVPAPAQTAGS